jgi:FAD/FMN-containing dehydrogenase
MPFEGAIQEGERMGKPTIDDLRTQVRGNVIGRDDPGYEDARKVYNAMIDRRPMVVVQAASAGDVQATVNFARENGLELSVRGGGHSVPGFGTNDDGVVIDLSPIREVKVDPEGRTAKVGGGATWADYHGATYEFGLASTGGLISTTGVGGLTLSGGIGHLARGIGLAIDNLLSAEVVTANGQLQKASEDENDDLFWAIRGGGGNFGAVTSFEFRLHPIKDIYAAVPFFELDHASDILRFYREFMVDAPEQLGLFPAYQIAPPLPFIPEDRVGDTFLALVACWAGPLEDAERALQPLRDVAPAVAELATPMPYPALASAFDDLLPKGLQNYWKSNFSKQLTDEAIDVHLEHGPKVPTVNSTMHVYSINGAVHRTAPDATAFAYRDATFATNIVGVWPDPADNEKNIKWVQNYYAATAPQSEEGGYTGFMAEDDQSRIKANYKGNYERLVQSKRKYDPDNLFHVNQNIKP